MVDTDYQVRQLRSTLSKMEIALSTVEECIVWTDRKGRIKWCNEALESLLGQPRLFLLSHLLQEKLPLYSDNKIVSFSEHPVMLALAKRENGKKCYEFRILEKIFILEVSWSFVQIDNNQSHHQDEAESSVLILRDVTQKLQAERQLQNSKKILEEQVEHRTKELQMANTRLQQESSQLQKLLNELKEAQAHLIQAEKMSGLGQLVAGIAHEINNPVNFIHGNLSYLSNYSNNILTLIRLYEKYYPNPAIEIHETAQKMELGFVQHDLPKIINSMKMGTGRISEIVRSLRNFSRMDEAELKSVDIHEGIESTILILQHRLTQPGSVPIQIVREYGKLPLVPCHAGQINQVLMNIIANAIDAIEEVSGQPDNHYCHEPPTIAIKTSSLINDWIEITISDNGTGIPDTVKSHIFNPFFTTKPVGKGTGMGMAISYKIITENHAGQLECRSAAGSGTEFMIRIPVYRGKA
jgi:two-component system, NtrC family, sensor kinase